MQTLNYKKKKILREMCVNNVWVLLDIMSDDIEAKRLGIQKRRWQDAVENVVVEWWEDVGEGQQ